ncbi:hypothetical protein RB597_009128 [Gaeumannomyces tritici]
MSKPWALVVPSSRGIGHHLTRRLLQRTTVPVLATCRRDPEGTKAALLRDLAPPPPLLPDGGGTAPPADRLHVVVVDVTDEGSIRAAASYAATTLFPRETHHLRLAFALPGVLQVDKSTSAVDAAATLESFRVNAIGPLLLMKHFVPLLPRGASSSFSSSPSAAAVASPALGLLPRVPPSSAAAALPEPRPLPLHAVWVNMTARVGSVSDNQQGGWYTYRATKSAVNSLTRTLDWELRARTAAGSGGGGMPAFAVGYHPGTVRTDFSREFWEASEKRGQLLEPEFAADKMLDVVWGLEMGKHRGRLWDWKGKEIKP